MAASDPKMLPAGVNWALRYSQQTPCQWEHEGGEQWADDGQPWGDQPVDEVRHHQDSAQRQAQQQGRIEYLEARFVEPERGADSPDHPGADYAYHH